MRCGWGLDLDLERLCDVVVAVVGGGGGGEGVGMFSREYGWMDGWIGGG